MCLNYDNNDLLTQATKQKEVDYSSLFDSDDMDDSSTTDDFDIPAVADHSTDRPPENHIAAEGTQPSSSEDSLYPPETLKALNYMNKEYATVLLGGKCRIAKEDFDTVNKKHILKFLAKNDFFDFHSHRRVSVNLQNLSEKKELAKIWFEWKDRRTYEDVVFDPSRKQGPKVYNLFRGFPLAPKKGDWSLMRKHIHDVICSGNSQHYEYLIAWMARILQDPGGDRPGVAVVLKAGKGVGKGVFADYFGSLIGEAYIPISDSESFTGKFNMHLSKSLVVFLDEAFCNGDKKAEGKMKSMITEPTVLFEPKGIDAITLPNHINVIIASNEEYVVPASSDERRFFVLEPSKVFQKDTDYFGRIIEERENGGPEAMMYDLLRHDYSNIDLRKAPITEALSKQIEHSLPPVCSFWYSILDRGYILTEKETGKPKKSELVSSTNCFWPNEVFKYEVYDEFVQWCHLQGHKKALDIGHFWKKTWKIWAGGKPSRDKKQSSDGTHIDALTLPTLAEAKKAFTLSTKIAFDDQEEDTEELL